MVVAYHRVSLEAVLTDPKPFVEAQVCVLYPRSLASGV